MPVPTEGPEPSEAPNLDPNEGDLFDPVAPATSTGPEASSPLPPAPDTWDDDDSEAPPRSPEPQPASSDDEAAPLPEFPEEFRRPFEGLLYLGKLTRTFTWMGHQFVIRTLVTDEHLEIGLIVNQYAGSLGEPKAYQTACAAACVVSVDGKALPVPISNEKHDTLLQARFDYVRRHWYPLTIDAVYEEFLVLDSLAEKVARAAGNSSG